MEINSQITISIKPDAGKSYLKLGALEPGSTLKLKIIALNGGRALIDFGNFRATADIKIPVTLGQELMVRVLEDGRQLRLGVINPDQKNPISPEEMGHRLETLPDENLNKLQKNLTQILNQSIDSSGGKKTPQSIFNVLANLNTYGDKETLQKIFDPKTLAILKNSIDTLLTDITRQQGRAVNQLESADPFQVFTYTLPLKEGSQAAKLRIYYEKKQKSGSQKGFQISLFLSMERLGDIRTDFYLLENDLNITFFVTESSTQIKIQENYSELRELLDSLFDQIQLKIKVSETKVRDFDRPIVQIANDRQVDLRI